VRERGEEVAEPIAPFDHRGERLVPFCDVLPGRGQGVPFVTLVDPAVRLEAGQGTVDGSPRGVGPLAELTRFKTFDLPTYHDAT
jgi:hypothetical protein